MALIKTQLFLYNILLFFRIGKPFSSIEISIHFYFNYLPNLENFINAKYHLWTFKWNLVKMPSRPTTSINTIYHM